MLSTRSPFEFEPAVGPELESPHDPGLGGETEGSDTMVTEEQPAEWEPLFEEGALGLRADAARKQDEDDDSDFGFDDFDDQDEPDEDEDLDNDLDDDEDELDEDFDEFEDSDEL